MTTLPCLNPDRLAPDVLTEKLGPFGSWPKDGSSPAGYFRAPAFDEAAAFYRENGYVVIENGVSAAEVERLKSETTAICRNDDGRILNMPEVDKRLSDVEVLKKVLCIHYPHKLSETFFKALAYPAITEVLRRAISPNVKAMQSMLFVKASGKPGQAWHQDEDYIPSRDRSLAGAWIALDDATLENGCLWVLPKSHARGILWPQKIHFDERFDCARESYNFPWDDADSVPVEVKAGSIVFFNGYLLHRSLPNRATTGYRRALVNHYMSAESLLLWQKPKAEDPTPMGQQDYRDIVMVAGEDPYAYKGVVNVSKAYVRPAGEGGCADWTDQEKIESAAIARDLAKKKDAKLVAA